MPKLLHCCRKAKMHPQSSGHAAGKASAFHELKGHSPNQRQGPCLHCQDPQWPQQSHSWNQPQKPQGLPQHKHHYHQIHCHASFPEFFSSQSPSPTGLLINKTWQQPAKHTATAAKNQTHTVITSTDRHAGWPSTSSQTHILPTSPLAWNMHSNGQHQHMKVKRRMLQQSFFLSALIEVPFSFLLRFFFCFLSSGAQSSSSSSSPPSSSSSLMSSKRPSNSSFFTFLDAGFLKTSGSSSLPAFVFLPRFGCSTGSGFSSGIVFWPASSEVVLSSEELATSQRWRSFDVAPQACLSRLGAWLLELCWTSKQTHIKERHPVD